MLAEITTPMSPVLMLVSGILGIASAAGAAINVLSTLATRRDLQHSEEIRKQGESTFAREAQQMEARVERLENSVEVLRGEVLSMERRMNAGDEQRAIAIHSRINELVEAVSLMRGEMKRKP
jgi:predicted  nucleic acid-binding Zn-ribbon protein